jgi:hypothetical protein
VGGRTLVERALTALEQVSASGHPHRQVYLKAALLVALGQFALRAEDLDRATAIFREVIRLSEKAENPDACVVAMEGLAVSAALRGQAARAARLGGAVDTARRELGAPIFRLEVAMRQQLLRTLAQLCNDTDIEAARAEGRAMSLKQALAFALADEGP